MAPHVASLPVGSNRHAHLGTAAGAVEGRVYPLPVRHHRSARPHLWRLVQLGGYRGASQRGQHLQAHGCSLQRRELAGRGVALRRWAGRSAPLGFEWHFLLVSRCGGAPDASGESKAGLGHRQRAHPPGGDARTDARQLARQRERVGVLRRAMQRAFGRRNIRYAYSYDFECVSNMGMHYCDYNWTSGGTSLAVCRQACASDLVGKSNNPYRWEWPESSVVASTPYTTCTGQPGCTPNGGFGTQQGLPACNEHNVGQTLAFNWYRQFYNPVRVDYQEITLTCRGPT